jgi:hypothetical protein
MINTGIAAVARIAGVAMLASALSLSARPPARP